MGAPELIIILLVVLLLFGSTKLPKLAKSLGQASSEFKKGVANDDAPPPTAEDEVTMSKAELDALLAERESAPGNAKVRKNPPSA